MTHVINNVLIGLNNIGRVFCDYAAGVFVQSAMLVILFLVVDLLLRKRVRAVFRYCVWLLVLVKLILPPTLSLPTGIGYWVGDHLPAASSISDRAFDVAGLERTSPSGEMPQVRPARDLPENEPSIMLVDSALTPLTWQAVLFILWLVGVFAFLVVLVQRIRFVRGLIAVSSPAKKELLGLLEQCRRKIGVSLDIRLRISETIPSPAVCGFLRPTVLIPTPLVEKLSPEGLRATLIHELAHIKRGDLWVNSVQTFLQVIYFYNPFVWFANAVIRRVCEEAVDETVLVTLGGEAKNYSNTLIDIGEMAFWRADLGLRLIGVAESKKALQWRIKHMLNRPIPKSSKLGALGIIVIFTIAAVLLPMARAQKPGEKSESIASENQQKSTKSLHQAARDGDIEQVKKLIAQGADVNANLTNELWTPLHDAAWNGRSQVVKLLLQHGAKVDVADAGGYTPLQYALWSEDEEGVKALISAGADINKRPSENDCPPLFYAVWEGYKRGVRILIDAGADFNADDGKGWTPFRYAVAGGSREMIELFVAKGADVPGFHLAACTGDLPSVKRFINQGTDVDTKAEFGWTPLYLAASTGQRDVVEFLVAKGADVNAKTDSDRTALHQAGVSGARELAELLISNGADVNATTKKADTPLHLAAATGHRDVVEFLIVKGADINVKDKKSETPLHKAAKAGHKEVGEILIAGGADVNAKEGQGRTPLHWAARTTPPGYLSVLQGRKDIAEVLIANGADLNAKNKWGQTPLHTAARNGRKEVGEILIAKGADINAKDNEGRTPLWWAKYRGRNETVELLRKHGAK